MVSLDTTVTFNSSDLVKIDFSITVVINNDSSYQKTEIDQGVTSIETGSLSVSGNTITTINSGNETETMEYLLQGNKLTIMITQGSITYIQEFTRQP